VAVDVRVICATHQDLEAAIAEGRFRQDLYYRVRGLELRVPPLRARREDVLVLANHFLERTAGQTDKAVPPFSREAVDRLLSYAWPGNVRELQHAVVAAAALAEGDEIRAADLPLPSTGPDRTAFDFSAFADLPLTEARSQLVEAFERWRIVRALDDHDGNVSAAARQLGIHRQNLQQKIAQLGIVR
jgi:DNA-binding NtrC family response regulator